MSPRSGLGSESGSCHGERVRIDSESLARGLAPLVGVLGLLALTVALAGVLAIGLGSWTVAQSAPTATFDLAVGADGAEVDIDHIAGEAVDVETLSVTVEVNGEALAHQPPVPFVGAEGFDGAPTGPFNAAADPTWTAGERASVRVAATNEPTIETGDAVTVTLATDGWSPVRLETTAR